jgi:hypothetical protein
MSDRQKTSDEWTEQVNKRAAMTDHAQRARAKRYDVTICNCADGPHIDTVESKTGNYVTYDDYAQAHAAGRRAGLEEAQRKVQSLCNKETHYYIQDKTGCNHPNAEVVHNGNAARVADDFRIWCRAKAKEGA